MARRSRPKEAALYTKIPVKEEASWRGRLKVGKTRTTPLWWTNPQESIGERCCNIGEQIFWEIKDPSRAKLAPLEVEVQEFLNDHNEHLKDREVCNLGFFTFIVGRCKETSCPTLVIISTSKESRQNLLAISGAAEFLRNMKASC